MSSAEDLCTIPITSTNKSDTRALALMPGYRNVCDETINIMESSSLLSALDDTTSSFLRRSAIPLSLSREALLSRVLESFSRIPYENLTKIARSHERCDTSKRETPTELLDSFWAYGTGGTCFSLTSTLVHLLRALGFETHPILANRRYGSDTHCAVIVKLEPNAWHLVDPGYLIHFPCLLPSVGSQMYSTSHSRIELERIGECAVTLSTVQGADRRYRLTYKTTPVDESAFQLAWDASFSWEMMTYPIIATVREGSQIYIQKSRVVTRSLDSSQVAELPHDSLAVEIARMTGISTEIVARALACLPSKTMRRSP